VSRRVQPRSRAQGGAHEGQAAAERLRSRRGLRLELILLGAIAGDVIGSVYEGDRIKHTDFPLFSSGSCFTDDTVLTIATAHALLTEQSYADAYHEFGNRYPGAG